MGNYWKPAYRSDDTNFLSDLGVKQAEILGIYLKRGDFDFHYVVSSALTRARQTTALALINMADWQRHYDPDSDLNECREFGHPDYQYHKDRVFRGMDRLMRNWTTGDALCITHYHTMQNIFDYLSVPRDNIESHKGKTIPNAIPFIYDLNDPTKIIKLDPSLHGPRY